MLAALEWSECLSVMGEGGHRHGSKSSGALFCEWNEQRACAYAACAFYLWQSSGKGQTEAGPATR